MIDTNSVIGTFRKMTVRCGMDKFGKRNCNGKVNGLIIRFIIKNL